MSKHFNEKPSQLQIEIGNATFVFDGEMSSIYWGFANIPELKSNNNASGRLQGTNDGIEFRKQWGEHLHYGSAIRESNYPGSDSRKQPISG